MPYIKSVGVFVLAMVFAALVNMGLILLGPYVIATPAGFDNTTQEGVMNTIHLLDTRHFIVPLLAHALGTLAGAWFGAWLAPHKLIVAMAVGVVSLAGGIGNIILIAAPVWFEVIDAIVCYIPMAWLGYKLALR